MAGMTTALTEHSNVPHRTYRYTGHTATRPKLVVQKRKVATSDTSVIEDHILVLETTEDSDGKALQSRVQFSALVRRPVNGQTAETTSALGVFRDIVASDEFTNLVNDQAYLA